MRYEHMSTLNSDKARAASEEERDVPYHTCVSIFCLIVSCGVFGTAVLAAFLEGSGHLFAQSLVFFKQYRLCRPPFSQLDKSVRSTNQAQSSLVDLVMYD